MPKTRLKYATKSGNSKKALTAISLFSGCGGMDLGFANAGFKIVWANDIDRDAILTYEKNLGEITYGDIRDPGVSPPDFMPSPDVLLAGFPCQTFSNAGSRQGTLDKRGTLYRNALQYAKRYSPSLVLFENVRGLLSIRFGKHLLVEEICQQLNQIGYSVYTKLLNASHYGIPQRRLRLFIVGVNKKLGEIDSPIFPNTMEGIDLSIGKALAGISKKVANQDELMPLSPQAAKLRRHIPAGGSWKDIPTKHLPERLKKIRRDIARYRWPNFYRRFAPNEIAGTVTAAFKPENAGVWHPKEDRIMSVREVARLQTFPDDFVFEGSSIPSKYRQIGNAVPPEIARLFGLRFKEILGKVKSASSTQDSILYRDFHTFFQAGQPLRPADPPLLYSARQSQKSQARIA